MHTHKMVARFETNRARHKLSKMAQRFSQMSLSRRAGKQDNSKRSGSSLPTGRFAQGKALLRVR